MNAMFVEEVMDMVELNPLRNALVDLSRTGSLSTEQQRKRLTITVELTKMNRLFFRPEQVGMTKTDVAVQTLSKINQDVFIEEDQPVCLLVHQHESPLHQSSARLNQRVLSRMLKLPSRPRRLLLRVV